MIDIKQIQYGDAVTIKGFAHSAVLVDGRMAVATKGGVIVVGEDDIATHTSPPPNVGDTVTSDVFSHTGKVLGVYDDKLWLLVADCASTFRASDWRVAR